MQTTVIFKADKKLKEAAQKTAKELGLPFSAVLNQFLRDIIAQREIIFTTHPKSEEKLSQIRTRK